MCDDIKKLNTPEKIKERCKRFGGIFWYVIAEDEGTVIDAMSAQLSAIGSTERSQLYVAYDNLERADDTRNNVSHFVLQYDVCRDAEEAVPFTNYTMRAASEFVTHQLFSQKMMEMELRQAIDALRGMFDGQVRRPEVFE